ncbi:MAG: TM0106 family RecB-like putative nuclease [Chthonomonadaceae bacterium]|nr:TM0106 family RecB-like putative nuclease [Chthonomonadaceae bacterium]
MQQSPDGLRFSASDLANHLGCRHLTQLNLKAARGEIKAPMWRDADLEALQQRGFQHEEAYLRHLRDTLGAEHVRLSPDLDSKTAVERTVELMRSGVAVIVQASLATHPWHGRADILLRTDTPSELGDWSYEVIDTKLARETRAETILQLCVYSELVGAIQGLLPKRTGVVTPLSMEPVWYRTSDAMAYYRQTKNSLLAAVASEPAEETQPEPVAHCEICRWWSECDRVWRRDDHLSLVAGISRAQRRELTERNVATVTALAGLPLPIPFKPARGAVASYERIREQARIQVESRGRDTPLYELRTQEPGLGLARLPEPSPGDVFLDLEGDPFAGLRGLKYLFGVSFKNADGNPAYEGRWAFTESEEKAAFEWLVALVEGRRRSHPDLHIFHFAPYEPAALKRLMGAYATCEDTIDDWLRSHLFVDLHRVVRESMIAGVERYSIKDLETVFGFDRQVPLEEARFARADLERAIELGELEAVAPSTRETVLGYNRDDCDSTLVLRDWLERVRAGQIEKGQEIPRPVVEEVETPELDERRVRVQTLIEALTEGTPVEEKERTAEQQAKWLLAHSLDYYWRESKVEFWERYRLKDLGYDEYADERCALADLEFVGEVGGTAKAPIHRYRFPVQECQLRDEDLYDPDDRRMGKLESLDAAERTIDIKKTGKSKHLHPIGVYGLRTFFDTKVFENALERLAQWVVGHGIDGPGPCQAVRELLLRQPPRVTDGVFEFSPDRIEDLLAEAKAVCRQLDNTVLPIQGPPGTGKTYLGARLIVDLVSQGKKVGVTANSHPVIRKLLNEVLSAGRASSTTVKVARKGDEEDPGIEMCSGNDQALAAIQGEADVLGGTKFLWAREEFADAVDVLVVDETSQLALPDVLAIGHSAKSLLLIGDPQQLERPQKGTHPPGVGVSPLDHLLEERATIPEDRGIFLPKTHRLHPSIAAFTSEAFYDSRLGAEPTLAVQRLDDCSEFTGAGPHFVPVPHTGNQSSSEEEVDCIARLVRRLVSGGTWTDKGGRTHRIGLQDILIIAPYNAQVGAIRTAIAGARVGTVDKFQGQEAPVAIYSMTTSTPEDAPRGLGFLYSLNRLNVATSRAKCAVVVVACPSLLEVDCRSPQQVRLVNALCRYVEMAAAGNR